MAQVAADFTWEQTVGNSLVVREPIGVVGAITPWNYPLHQIAAKVAPALAAGCTVVLKPSEVAPLNAFVLAEIFEEVGLPAGVFNLVTGFGPVVGEAIAAHPDVDMVSFTGSTRAGRRVSEVAAATVKRVALELGGKSANVILDDADLAQAVPDGVRKCYINSGQTCSALTRMLVPRDRLAEVEDAGHGGGRVVHPRRPLRRRDPARAAGVGRPAGPGPQLHRQGGRRGGQLLTGGAEAPDGLDTGFFVRPTVFSSVTRDMTIARDEIFGPVLAIIPYDSEEEAVDIANDTEYGLAGGVWSATPTGPRRWPAGSGPARSRSTGAGSTRWPRSAATSSRATAGSSAPSAWRSSSRSSRCSSEHRLCVRPCRTAGGPSRLLRSRTGPRPVRGGSGRRRCRSSRR